MLYAYRVHIVFTGTHFMHLQTSVFVDRSFKLQECEGFETSLLYKATRLLLLVSSFVYLVLVKGKGSRITT